MNGWTTFSDSNHCVGMQRDKKLYKDEYLECRAASELNFCET